MNFILQYNSIILNQVKMGACLQAVFTKNISPKQQSLLMTSSPSQLNQIMGLQSSNTDEFYCSNDITKIQQILKIFYNKMNNIKDNKPQVKKEEIREYINKLGNFITEMKDQHSKTYRRFKIDREEVSKFHQNRQKLRNKSFSKKSSSFDNQKHQNKPMGELQIVEYSDIIVLKLIIKYVITSGGRKTCQIFLNKEPLTSTVLGDQSMMKTEKSTQASNSKKTNKEQSSKKVNQSNSKNSKSNSENQEEVNYLKTYKINEFINIVTLKSSTIVIKVPQINAHTSIPLSQLIFRGNSIIISDMIPLKAHSQDNIVKGYISLSAQAFQAHTFEEDYYNIIKQHEMLKKQLQYCEKGQWQNLYDLRNSSASHSQKSLQKQDSIYSDYIKDSAQFQIKF